MARYKGYDYTQTVLIPVSLENQLLPGTVEFAIQALVERRMDTALFSSRYKNDATGCPAYDPKILLKVILFAYARGIISSRKIEQACRENVTFMALACGQVPDHSTLAAFVSSLKAEIAALFRDILLVCAEQDLLGGTHFALDGVKLPSNAAKEWSGTFAGLRRKQEKLEAKLQQVLAQHERADKEEGEATAAARHSEQQRRHDQLQRLERQAARIKTFLAANDPKRGKQGQELQSNVTDNESAKLFTAHGVLQGYNSQALVDAKHQVIVHAEAFGNGQDYGHVPPMLEGAKAHVQAIGLGEDYFAGKILSADSNYHSEENLKTCAQEQLDAYIPDSHFRQRDPRFATQPRHHPPTDEQVDEKFTEADFCYDREQDCYCCPGGKMLTLRARRHQVGNNLYRRYEAAEADCQGCPFREQCLHTPETRRKHLAVFVEQVKETLSQQMSAKIDTPEARELYGQRLAIVEPVFGNIRSQKRLDHLTLRGKIKVNIQWMLYCIVHNIEKVLHYGGAVERWGQGGSQTA
jgi:transposase